MKKSEFIKYYWKYYQYLEKQFILTEKYVSVEADNYACYSLEYLSLFILVCNEFDAITTQYYKHIKHINDSDNINTNIIDKTETLKENIENFSNLSVKTNQRFSNINLSPLVKFSSDKSSDWWQAYNSVKHQRLQLDKTTKKPNYYKANLKNLLLSMSALYIILNKYYYEICEDEDNFSFELKSDLFNNLY